MSDAYLISAKRLRLHNRLTGPEGPLSVTPSGVPSIADVSSPSSVNISAKQCELLVPNVPVMNKKVDGQKAGRLFEQAICDFLEQTFPKLCNLRPGTWEVKDVHTKLGIAAFRQYEHLAEIADLLQENERLKSSLGTGYLIKLDIIISRQPEDDDYINQSGLLVDDINGTNADIRLKYNSSPILHASISAKWTIRSDRVQNSRSEALNLIRNRKGPTPHVVVVTAEPTPVCLAAIALGTGDIDCVYHFVLNELTEAIANVGNDDSKDMLNILIEGRRLKDISDLPLDLCV